MKPSPRGKGAARFAILGAAALEGVRVREALERARVPGPQVNLFGELDGEALISEYAGDARLIQQTDLQTLVEHDVVFVCERSAMAKAITEQVHGECVVIDLVSVHADGNAARLVGAAAADEPLLAAGSYRVPHSLSLLLADLLRPLENGPGVQEVVAVVLRPASDYGPTGVEELQQQTVRLLNCIEMPTATFGRQLAFNIVPEGGLSCCVPDLEQELSRQVSNLLGWSEERLAVRLLAAPLFYGQAVELRVRATPGTTLADIEDAFDQSEFQRGAGRGPEVTSPMEVADSRSIRLGEISSDGIGGFWLWAVAGGSASRTAELAVNLARRTVGL